MRLALCLAALILAAQPTVGSAAPSEQTPAPLTQASGGPAPAPPVQAGGGLVIQSDLTIGAPGPCTLQSRFRPGDRVIFRAKVIDGQTGEVVPTATATVRLSDGTTMQMNYGDHPPPQVNLGPATDSYWVVAWAIRPDAPLGVVRYTIEATDGTRTGRFEPFNFEGSMLTIVPAGS